MTARRLLALTVTVGALVLAAAAAAEQSYTDSRGDSGVGMDITNLTVRSDPAGNVSIQIAVATPIVDNHAIAIFVDADRNPSTGSSGDDYWMIGGPLAGIDFFRWNGSDFVPFDAPGFWVGGANTNVMEFRFHRSALGGTGAFDFTAISVSLDETSAGLEYKAWDFAPNTGAYTYSLSRAPSARTGSTTTATASPTTPPTPAARRRATATSATRALRRRRRARPRRAPAPSPTHPGSRRASATRGPRSSTSASARSCTGR